MCCDEKPYSASAVLVNGCSLLYESVWDTINRYCGFPGLREFWLKYRPAFVNEIIRIGDYNNNNYYSTTTKSLYEQYFCCRREINFRTTMTKEAFNKKALSIRKYWFQVFNNKQIFLLFYCIFRCSLYIYSCRYRVVWKKQRWRDFCTLKSWEIFIKSTRLSGRLTASKNIMLSPSCYCG